MGNLVLNCVPVVPSEGREGGNDKGRGKTSDADSDDDSVGNAPIPMSEVENIHEPPTTIAKVLSNALFAVAFHKHLALT